MRQHLVFSLSVALLTAACGSKTDERTYPLKGQVISISGNQANIKHEEIKGFMAAMTMPYKVSDPKLLEGIAPGDLIDATLVVIPNDAYLTEIKKVGHTPLEKPQSEAAPPASSGFELLKAGDPVPDAQFVNQDGKARRFSSFKGSPVVMTFIYTKCPLPTFCPMMDRHFVTIQQTLKSNPALKNVHLVSVSFDPVTDTPPVLKKHAQGLKADLSRWSFLTGKRDDIDQFAARFGLNVARSETDPRDITHNLRTVIIDADGKLVTTYTGNEWTPEQVLTDLNEKRGRES